MIIYTTIEKYDNFNIVNLKYWIIDKCKKWIIQTNNDNINILFIPMSNGRMDNIIKSFKDYLNKKNINILNIKGKKLNINYDLTNILKTIFFPLIDKDYNFTNIELKGYTKQSLITLLTQTDNKPPVSLNNNCKYCSKSFSTKSNCNRHLLICEKKLVTSVNNENIEENKEPNIKTIITDAVENVVNNKMDVLTNMFKDLSDKINTTNINNINSNNSTTNNVNIQINNNYKTKKEKLDHYFKHRIDLDTFITKYSSDPKYHLTKDEAEILIQNSENLGVEGYSSGLYTYLKKKYCLQLEDLTGDKKKYYEISLPFISTDTKGRTHYELTKNDGWLLSSSNDKIKSIVNISDQQIFNHHNKFICYSAKRGKKTIINIFLRKSYYNTTDPQLTDSSLTNAIES
jgi:hypothetical protein